MPERGYTVFHKPIAAVYECVLQEIDRRCCCMGCVQAKAAPGNYSVLHVRLESKSHENLFVLVMCDFSFLGVTALNVDYASELDLLSLLA
jgi:hypothetical protein